MSKSIKLIKTQNYEYDFYLWNILTVNRILNNPPTDKQNTDTKNLFKLQIRDKYYNNFCSVSFVVLDSSYQKILWPWTIVMKIWNEWINQNNENEKYEYELWFVKRSDCEYNMK